MIHDQIINCGTSLTRMHRVSTAQDAQHDRAQIFVAASPHIAVGAALEQHLSSGEEIIPNFCLILCNYNLIGSHLIIISTSRFELFAVKLSF